MSRLPAALVPLILCLAISSAVAEMSATEILKKSYYADARASYSGRMRTTVYTASGGTSADVLINRNGAKTRMEYLSGASAGTVLLDDGKSVTQLDSRARTAYVSGTPEAPERLDLLLANYTAVLVGKDSIAGRNCYTIAVRPKASGNPSKRLWVDRGTFLALKTERFSFDGRRTMSSEYTNIDYSKRPDPSIFSIPEGWKTVRLGASGDSSLESVRSAVGFTPRKPSHVPPGYGFGGYYLRENPRGMRFAGLRYTNGMNTVSIFERKGQCGNGWGFGRGRGRGQGAPRRGCASCMLDQGDHAQIACSYTGGLTIVVVGDLSADELGRIVNSF